MDGQLVTRHCNNSRSKTYHGDQWITIEAGVRGNERSQQMLQKLAD